MMTAWIHKSGKGWLKDYRQKKERNKEIQEEERKEDKGNPADMSATKTCVIYNPLKCPKCQSKNIKCYKTDLPVRYHICKNCGVPFKSFERD